MYCNASTKICDGRMAISTNKHQRSAWLHGCTQPFRLRVEPARFQAQETLLLRVRLLVQERCMQSPIRWKYLTLHCTSSCRSFLRELKSTVDKETGAWVIRITYLDIKILFPSRILISFHADVYPQLGNSPCPVRIFSEAPFSRHSFSL